MADFMIARGLVVAQLQPVERAGASQGAALVVQAIPAQWVLFAGRHRQEWVQSQGVVIVEILITQRQGVQALGQQLLDGVVHKHLLAQVVKTVGQSARKPQALIDLAQEQDATITAEMAAGKVGLHLAGS